MYLQALTFLPLTVLPPKHIDSSATHNLGVTLYVDMKHFLWSAILLPTERWPQQCSLTRVTLNHSCRTPIHAIWEYSLQCTYPLFISEAESLDNVLIYASIVLKMHNNAYLTYICTYTHIITHIAHANTYLTWRYHINLDILGWISCKQ